MRDVSLIQKELGELTGRKARLGSPDEEVEDPRVQNLETQIAEQEAKLAELRAEIARLEALAGMTPEDEARLAGLQKSIEEAEAEVTGWQVKVAQLEVEVPLWKAKRDTARLLLGGIALNKVQRFEQYSGYPTLEYYLLPAQAGLDYFNAWRADAVEEVAAYEEKFTEGLKPPTFWHDIRGITESELNQLLDEARSRGEIIPYGMMFWPSKHDFAIHKWHNTFVKYVTELVGRGESEIAVHLREVYGIQYMPWIYPDAASIWRSKVSSQEALATSQYESLFAELTAARDSLERAKRAVGDAKAAYERASLEIRRAVALREAEVDIAKAQYELELRTLANLKATYDVLLKEIELAKLQAIAEAARQREEVIKASEEERLAIAEEMRKIAEEAERKAEEALGIAREEYLDRMRRALEIAKEAEEAAIAAALEREATAKEIATRKAELAQIELELEELRKQQEIAEERKEEAEKAVAGLPALPKWFWPVAGIAGAGLGVTGIGLALRKKKKAK